VGIVVQKGIKKEAIEKTGAGTRESIGNRDATTADATTADAGDANASSAKIVR
jgi:hypothetical protein